MWIARHHRWLLCLASAFTLASLVVLASGRSAGASSESFLTAGVSP